VTRRHEPARSSQPRLDLLSIALAPLGILIVLLAQYLDGSPFGALLQGSSALVVGGGTLAAILISYTPLEIGRAIGAAGKAFRAAPDDVDVLAAQMVTLSIRAHRKGLPALEPEVDDIHDPFLREGLALVVDGTSAQLLNEMLTLESSSREAEEEAPARIFEAAAGYAPTMGILGAVLGLMRVMEHLSAPGALGSGIALAFVATVYGVGGANLVLLPIAGRLRERAAVQARRRELMIQGLQGLQQRLNPRLLGHKLRAFSSRVPRIDELSAMPMAPGRQIRNPRIPA
jgi:chemotaxis protein MotA